MAINIRRCPNTLFQVALEITISEGEVMNAKNFVEKSFFFNELSFFLFILSVHCCFFFIKFLFFLIYLRLFLP